jgi:hypothetical protein
MTILQLAFTKHEAPQAFFFVHGSSSFPVIVFDVAVS